MRGLGYRLSLLSIIVNNENRYGKGSPTAAGAFQVRAQPAALPGSEDTAAEAGWAG
jgi:hypothetical protein